jgi:hypothetical protein
MSSWEYLYLRNKKDKIFKKLYSKKNTSKMGNSTTFKDIEKKYGQNGIDYVAFRYH